MGSGGSKDADKELGLFSGEERNILTDNFKLLAGKNKIVDKSAMKDAIVKLLNVDNADIFAQRMGDLMTGQINTIKSITFEGYVHCAAFMIKGLLEDKGMQYMYLASGRQHAATPREFLEFTKLVIQISFKLLLKLQAVQSWHGSCYHNINEESVNRLAAAFTRDLEGHDAESNLELPAVTSWLSKTHQLLHLLDMIGHEIFQLPMGRTTHLIPMCRGIPGKVYPSWLSLASILYINAALPEDLRKEWRFLFSSRIHGESFSSLLGAVVDKGPSIIVIKDQDGHIFGGFASTSWTVNPHFTGTDKNFVFSLAPEMAIYHTTGYNDHYQYLNIQQQTFPNGLGMGGQLEYFGFWIDAEYGQGKSSPTCTTYGSKQLSAKPDFLIDRLEVWAVGPEPEKEEETERRLSIVDVDTEGMAMLRILDRGPVSEGLRENPTAGLPEETTYNPAAVDLV